MKIIAIDNVLKCDKVGLRSFLYKTKFYKSEKYELISTEKSLLNKYKYVILLSIDQELIEELIDKSIQVGIILDCNDNSIENIEKLSYKTLEAIKFIQVVGGRHKENRYLKQIPFISSVLLKKDKNEIIEYQGIYSTDNFYDLYQLILEKTKQKYKYLSTTKSINNYLEKLEKITDEITYMHLSDFNIYQFLSSINKLYSASTKLDQLIIEAYSNNIEVELINFKENLSIKTIPIEMYYKKIFPELINKFENFNHQDDIVNIICFKASYLFKDLCERFVKHGCVLSDYPLINAKSYIWMRPQEIFQYIDAINNKPNKSTPQQYLKLLPVDIVNENILKARSVSIHHGTCFEPIYQFDYKELALNLRKVNKVVGVCEFEECYGPSAQMANKNNFSFVPIGYDNILFNESHIKTRERTEETKINIGFVGRAYGTDNKKNLSNSKLAHPKGYRKGGDILLNTALRLKNKKINFKITILGQNWEELCERFDSYGIEYKYYAREENIEYKEFPNVYKDFDLLFIGARCEGGPVSAIEAMSLGIPIVGTNVGILRYLSKISNNCNIFEFDRKWHTVDYDKAVNLIENIYKKKTTYDERLRTRKDVVSFSTDNWVTNIINKAKDI